MTLNGISRANNGMQAGSSGRITQLDSVSKNIQNQIANAQKKLQELSSNEGLSIEDKMKKRQEIQQEINNLNQQLRQHQVEQIKEQQTKKHLWMICLETAERLLRNQEIKVQVCHRQVCRR